MAQPKSMRVATITAFGGPEVLAIQEREIPSAVPGHLVVQVHAAGLNFLDVVQRRGGYPDMPAPPLPAGVEGAGVVVQVGDGVDEFPVGSRVAWAMAPGSHADYVMVPAAGAVLVPDKLSLSTAAGVLAQGLTAHYLATSLRPLSVGHSVLIWSAAGGVGLFLTQLLARQGVQVVAVVSSDDKAPQVLAAGAAEVVSYDDDVVSKVRKLTDGAGVDAVFDGIGAPTFDSSLGSLRPRGLLVTYGGAGGELAAVDPARLAVAGSVYLIRPRLTDFVATRRELVERADELFQLLDAGKLQLRIGGEYALQNVADAHRALESRTTTGKLLIVPGQ